MIEIINFTTASVDEKFLKMIARKVLKAEGLKKDFDFSIALIGERRMRALNKKYRSRNRATDVLSFGYNFESSRAFVDPPDNVLRLGEVVICFREAKKNAEKIGHSVKKEMAILAIHGILHLLGYDHEDSSKDAEKMRFAEDKILKALSI